MYYTGMAWLLAPEPPQAAPPAPLVEDLLVSRDYLQSDEPLTWLRRQMVLSREVIETTETLTKGQRDNPMWPVMRKMRVTASNFGSILTAKTPRWHKYKITSPCFPFESNELYNLYFVLSG